MNIFVSTFFVLTAFCAALCYFTQKLSIVNDNREFISFQRTYLLVYTLAMAGDWLQGPYVYALYEHYSMTKREIEILFVAGFGSSMVFGTFVGSFADKYGRKFNCILYGAIYIVSCLTKHFNNFWILMVGRFAGGIATSILFSAFESWLICHHNQWQFSRVYSLNEGKQMGFDGELLKTIFSNAVLCNSVVAILSGVLAQYAVDLVGYVAPFDLAIGFLGVMNVIIFYKWTENYGNQNANIRDTFQQSLQVLKTDRRVLCLGVVQSLFEASMYCFVLEWTPILEFAVKRMTEVAAVTSGVRQVAAAESDGHRGSIPHGYIFAAFMVALMIGSCVFKLLCKRSRPESFMRSILILSALTFALPIIFPESPFLIFVAFLVFEVCVGVFWPSMGTMRGIYVPEEVRATIMNCFRVPLNLIVVFILSQNLSASVIFAFCAAFLLCCTLFQQWLFSLCTTDRKLLPVMSESAVESPDCVKDKEALLGVSSPSRSANGEGLEH